MDEHHYQYSDFHAFPEPQQIPIEYDVQFYHHDDQNALPNSMHNAMMGCVPVSCAPDTAIKGTLPGYPQWRYPPPPASSNLAYWSPASPFEESVRSPSPLTDIQSSRCMSSVGHDDAVSCVSGFESSPSPSYHEPMQVALYEGEPGNGDPESIQSISQDSPIFQLYTPHPIEYASPTSSFNEPHESPSKTPTPRKETTRSTRIQKRNKSQKNAKAPSRSKTHADTQTTCRPANKKPTNRKFECSFSRYGCTSTFPSKNEWKRHVSSQHIQPGFYRCDIGRCSLNTLKDRDSTQSSIDTLLVNDFNRKDLFIQHQRRMHAPWNDSKDRKQTVSENEKNEFESTLEDVWKRCWRQMRSPPMHSQCGFCEQEFRGQNAWKERMEHVARHFEKADPGPEVEDIHLREWAEEEGIIQFVKGEWKLTSLCRK